MESLRRGDCGSSFVEDVLSQHPAMFGKVLSNASHFRLQVLVSVPVDAPDGRSRLVRHGYRVDEEYFYPARNKRRLLYSNSSLLAVRGN